MALTWDYDHRLVVNSVGTYRGGERIVEAIFQLPDPAGVPPVTIFAEERLSIEGDAYVFGPNQASIHSNSNIDISGNPTVEGEVTASGDINISGNPQGVDGEPFAWTAQQPRMETPYVFPPAYKPVATHYFTADCDVHAGWPTTAANLLFDDVKLNGPWNGWICDYNRQWELPTDDALVGFIYVEGNVKMNGSPGQNSVEPVTMSIVAEGYIEISGNPRLQPYYTGDFDAATRAAMEAQLGESRADRLPFLLRSSQVLFLAGNDLKFNGNAANTLLVGVMAAHQEFSISGNPQLTGALIAENGYYQAGQEVTFDRLVDDGIVAENYISGVPTITDFASLNGGAQSDATMEAWRELVEL